MKLRIYLLTLLLGVLGFAGCEAAEQNMRETALPASAEAPAEKTIAESHGKAAKEETDETPLLPIDASPLASDDFILHGIGRSRGFSDPEYGRAGCHLAW